jgi:hypothetical protein
MKKLRQLRRRLKKYSSRKFAVILGLLTTLVVVYLNNETVYSDEELHIRDDSVFNLDIESSISTNETDIVFTWVNGNDASFLKLVQQHKSDLTRNRVQNHDELRYSLRSIEKYAPWARYIFIVTNGQIPRWLNLSHPKIKLISHKQIFPNKVHLPTFNSLAIESHLHRIPGLSRRFLYFNDDILLGKPISIEDFYTPENGFKIRLAWTVPSCNSKCPISWINDGHCDSVCNIKICKYDGGDCGRKVSTTKHSIYREIFIQIGKVIGAENIGYRNEDLEEAVKALPGNNSVKTKKYLQGHKRIKNRLFQRLYENYYDFLSWCRENGLLSESGLDHKMQFLYQKIRDKLDSISIEKDFTQTLKSDSLDESKTQELYNFVFKNWKGFLFDGINSKQMKDGYLNKTSADNVFLLFKKRKLLDKFFGSLVYTERLLNRIYGYSEIRRVPVHAPLLIDIEIMQRLQDKFKDQFEKTSSNKFRTSTDIQYAFAYYYFVMNEFEEFNASRFFDEADLNRDRFLEPSELNLLHLKFVFIDNQDSNTIKNDLSTKFLFHQSNCHNNMSVKMDRIKFLKCSSLLEFLEANLWNEYDKKCKYKFEKLGIDDSKFMMLAVTDNLLKIHLNSLAKRPKKFICFNDDIDYSYRSKAYHVWQLVTEFYLKLFPKHSLFELPDHKSSRNPFSVLF